jgi:TPP-dependent 2-oxoacid decarboxylase
MGDQKESSQAKETCSIGRYFTHRLVQAGVSQVFTVPGDFNLVLLDEICNEEDLNLVRCTNELNAGYAADGCSRSTGMMSVLVGSSLFAVAYAIKLSGFSHVDLFL